MALAWALVLVATAVAAMWALLGGRLRLYLLAARFAGPTLWVPGFGTLIDVILYYGLSGLQWCHGYYERFGPVYGLWVGHKFTVVTSHPDDIEAIVTSPALIDKASNYALLWPWLGDGLLLLGGKKWHVRRKQLTPTFHFRILEQFVDVFNDKGAILEEKFRRLVGQGVVDVRPFISRHALDVICETAMGTTMNAQLQEDSEYVKAIKTACKSVDDRHAYPWLANDILFRMTKIGRDFYKAMDVIHGTTHRVVASRKAELQNEMKSNGGFSPNTAAGDETGLKQRLMFIDQLLSMHLRGEDLSEKDIFDEVNTFMFEGHDTTTTSVCFTLYLLATHPAIQDRAAEEVRHVIGDSSAYSSAQLADLKFLDAVIKESLRLYPSVPFFIRMAKEDFKLPSGNTLPAGSSVMINVYMSHRTESNFANPSKFDPERFLVAGESGDGASTRHHFSYIPFSAGFRNCIGQRFAMMSMKATLARLLHSVRFLPGPGDALGDLDVQVVLTTKSGMPLIVQERQ